MDRRRILSIAAFVVIAVPAFAADDVMDGKVTYRGFTVDVSRVQNAPNFAAVESSMKRQLDIVADCGAKPEIIEFFRGRRIFLVHGLNPPPGLFTPGHGIDIEAGVLPKEQPIILHELLHAYHFLMLPPGKYKNQDVLRFYQNAIAGRRYPPANRNDKYVLKDVKEFFAVTASLYLWGKVDRQPHDRENLKKSQPNYYVWLGELFGVEK